MKSKRYIYLIAALTLMSITAFFIPTVARAQESPNQSVELEVPVIDSSASETNAYSADTESQEITPSAASGVVGSAEWRIIRSGSSSNCELRLYWSANQAINTWRFKKLEVKGVNLIYSQTYKTMGNGKSYITYGAVASPIGSVSICGMTIPTSQKSVTIRVSSLQGYYLQSGWVSFVTTSNWNIM